MQKRYILLLLVIILAVFIYTGNRNVEQSISIGSCSASFQTEPVFVTSPLCANGTSCTASPGDQQNNAVVDVLLCACESAKAGNYADAELNKKIENLTAAFYSYAVAARDLCEQPVLLVRRQYG